MSTSKYIAQANLLGLRRGQVGIVDDEVAAPHVETGSLLPLDLAEEISDERTAIARDNMARIAEAKKAQAKAQAQVHADAVQAIADRQAAAAKAQAEVDAEANAKAKAEADEANAKAKAEADEAE